MVFQVSKLVNSGAVPWSLAFSLVSPLVRFWNNLTALQAAAVVSALVLAIGAIVEYWSKLRLLAALSLKLILGKSTPFERCVFKKLLLHSIGPIFVVLGIAGEFVFEGRTFVVQDKQEEQARQTIGSLDTKAEKANGKADEALGKLDTASKKADVIQTQLDEESKELNGIEEKLSAQGSRAILLINSAPKLVKQLAPFAGQKVRLFVCGTQGSVHQETLDTWGAIANILGSETVGSITGAKWRILDPNLGFAANCGAAGGRGQGQGVAVSKRASKRTIAAATVFADALVRILPPSENKMLGFIDPDFQRMIVDRGFQPRDEPWNIVAFDDDLIAVTVGEHP